MINIDMTKENKKNKKNKNLDNQKKDSLDIFAEDHIKIVDKTSNVVLLEKRG